MVVGEQRAEMLPYEAAVLNVVAVFSARPVVERPGEANTLAVWVSTGAVRQPAPLNSSANEPGSAVPRTCTVSLSAGEVGFVLVGVAFWISTAPTSVPSPPAALATL